MQRRLAALEMRSRPAGSYVVRKPADADDDAVIAAIAEHRLRTGWTGPVMLAEPDMTEDEWLARFGL